MCTHFKSLLSCKKLALNYFLQSKTPAKGIEKAAPDKLLNPISLKTNQSIVFIRTTARREIRVVTRETWALKSL